MKEICLAERKEDNNYFCIEPKKIFFNLLKEYFQGKTLEEYCSTEIIEIDKKHTGLDYSYDLSFDNFFTINKNGNLFIVGTSFEQIVIGRISKKRSPNPCSFLKRLKKNLEKLNFSIEDKEEFYKLENDFIFFNCLHWEIKGKQKTKMGNNDLKIYSFNIETYWDLVTYQINKLIDPNYKVAPQAGAKLLEEKI
jgi:hypothetical protein